MLPEEALKEAAQTIHLTWVANLYEEKHNTAPAGPVEAWAPDIDPKVETWIMARLCEAYPLDLPEGVDPVTFGHDLGHKALGSGGMSGEYDDLLRPGPSIFEFTPGYELVHRRSYVDAAGGDCRSTMDFGPKLRAALKK